MKRTILRIVLVIALLIGAFIYLVSIADADLRQMSRRRHGVEVGIAFLNSLCLFMAAVGISTSTGG